MLLTAAASNKVSEARPKTTDMFTLPNTKKQQTQKACETTNYITAACVKFVHSYNASVIQLGTTSCDTLPPTHLHAVFASCQSAFRFAYQLESVSALHSSRPNNTRCGPQLSTSILPSSRHQSLATKDYRVPALLKKATAAALDNCVLPLGFRIERAAQRLSSSDQNDRARRMNASKTAYFGTLCWLKNWHGWPKKTSLLGLLAKRNCVGVFYWFAGLEIFTLRSRILLYVSFFHLFLVFCTCIFLLFGKFRLGRVVPVKGSIGGNLREGSFSFLVVVLEGRCTTDPQHPSSLGFGTPRGSWWGGGPLYAVVSCVVLQICTLHFALFVHFCTLDFFVYQSWALFYP